ncbi:MAG: hypothetical protein F7C33_07160 [Desulfurococcales archaeon]|nr:hypothetical protein [Desulfurococcales archaeon]
MPLSRRPRPVFHGSRPFLALLSASHRVNGRRGFERAGPLRDPLLAYASGGSRIPVATVSRAATRTVNGFRGGAPPPLRC